MEKKNRLSTTDYTICFDGEFVDAFPTLKEAREFVRKFNNRADIEQFPDSVVLRKRTVVELVLNEYKSEHKKVLVVGELDMDEE